MHHDCTARIQDPQRILLCNLIRMMKAIDKNYIECELIGGKELITRHTVYNPLIGIHSNRKLKHILHNVECSIRKTSYLQVATIMKGLL